MASSTARSASRSLSLISLCVPTPHTTRPRTHTHTLARTHMSSNEGRGRRERERPHREATWTRPLHSPSPPPLVGHKFSWRLAHHGYPVRSKDDNNIMTWTAPTSTTPSHHPPRRPTEQGTKTTTTNLTVCAVHGYCRHLFVDVVVFACARPRLSGHASSMRCMAFVPQRTWPAAAAAAFSVCFHLKRENKKQGKRINCLVSPPCIIPAANAPSGGCGAGGCA